MKCSCMKHWHEMAIEGARANFAVIFPHVLKLPGLSSGALRRLLLPLRKLARPRGALCGHLLCLRACRHVSGS